MGAPYERHQIIVRDPVESRQGRVAVHRGAAMAWHVLAHGLNSGSEQAGGQGSP
jgi:hypothetical protein